MAIAAGWLALALLAQGDVESRVEATLRQMTLEEKIDLIGGVDGFYVRGVPRLNVPRLKMSDGPVGVRNYGPTTAYPATLALAATFDPELARKFGTAIGRDSRARGVHIWLAPGVNLARVPQNGRNFEYLGEDPLVAGKLAAGIIRGVQSQGVVATVKHFAGNEHEDDRNRDSSVIDERTLRELYLRPFERAVKEGNVWAVMSGYNLLNGTYCAEHPWLVDQVLKKEWGFKGIYMSDWGAVHSTLGTFRHGLDLEMPGPDFLNQKAIKPLLEKGEVSVAMLDDKVRRILRLTYAMEFDKRPQEDKSIPAADATSEAAALAVAREGTVLLQNRNGLLPLDRGRVRKILVVGPNGEPGAFGGGGSSYTTPSHRTHLVQAIRAAAGSGVDVRFRLGLPDPIASVKATDLYLPDQPTVKGVRAEYFANVNLQGTPAVVREDPRIDFKWNAPPAAGLGNTQYSVRWTGAYRPQKAGDHLFVARSDDGIRVSVDGKRVIDSWGDRGATTDVATVKLEAGRSYRIVVEYYQGGGEAEARFGIMPGGWSIERDLPSAEVKSADVVVIASGLNDRLEGEGFDRPFRLPAGQEALLKHVLALNPRTVIVNNSGGPVDLAPFTSKAGAILQAWYPGMNGNQAVAEILFGTTNPSGKLPLSWPGDLRGTYYESAYPSKGRQMPYREGLFMGYRWFDANKNTPLFPFGKGLSYTTFALSKPEAKVAGEMIEIAVTVKNTGRRAGTETVQVYSGYVKESIPRPIRELRGFSRTRLQPGEERRIHLSIPKSDLAYYSVREKGWRLEKGAVNFWIGTSSRDLPLRLQLEL